MSGSLLSRTCLESLKETPDLYILTTARGGAISSSNAFNAAAPLVRTDSVGLDCPDSRFRPRGRGTPEIRDICSESCRAPGCRIFEQG